MREAGTVGTLVHSKPDDHRRQMGKRRQAGMSAALLQEFGQYNLLPGCARLIVLFERAVLATCGICPSDVAFENTFPCFSRLCFRQVNSRPIYDRIVYQIQT